MTNIDPLSHNDPKPETKKVEENLITETLPLPKEEQKLVEVPKPNPIFAE